MARFVTRAAADPGRFTLARRADKPCRPPGLGVLRQEPGQPLMMPLPDRRHVLLASACARRGHQCLPDLARAARPGRGSRDGEAVAELSHDDV
jgi:hypothetical protein